MTEVRWDGGASYEMVLDASSKASPAAVYDVLADLARTWTGPARGSTGGSGSSR